MGRRKIDISMVDDPNNRQVTFSKRRSGLFKKANELSILCNAEMAVVMFSPGDKPYSFGHPNVNVVAEKFLQQPDASNVVERNHEPENNPSYDTEILTRQLSLVQVHIGEEHKKASELDKREKNQEAMEDLEVSPAFQRMVEDYVDAMEVSEYMLLLAKKPVVGVTNQAITNKRRKN